jgi:hypothetical protein
MTGVAEMTLGMFMLDEEALQNHPIASYILFSVCGPIHGTGPNLLTAVIPSEIGNMTSIQHLHLGALLHYVSDSLCGRLLGSLYLLLKLYFLFVTLCRFYPRLFIQVTMHCKELFRLSLVF